jgi:hypothetical protein
MVVLIKPAIRLESDPGVKRVGSGVMWVAIVIGLMFMALWLTVAVFTFEYNAYWSVVIAGAALAFTCFLCLMAKTLIRDGSRRYFLELTDTEAVLNVFEGKGAKRKRATQMVLLDDIQYAEYYPYRDSSAVILHTTYAHMEVPLWPMGSHAQDVLDFLEGRGVPVVNVQSDDPIPPDLNPPDLNAVR